jgi:hypothetical protein
MAAAATAALLLAGSTATAARLPLTAVGTTAGQVPVSLHAADTRVATTIPVDLSASTAVRIMRVVVPVTAGDVLDLDADGRVTNDVGYNVGVGWYLAWYDYDDGVPWPHAQPWTKIGTSSGDNVDPTRHHMPMKLGRAYKVPDTWLSGHRMVVNFMVDAHSTAWQAGDTLTVDDLGLLKVTRWATPT